MFAEQLKELLLALAHGGRMFWGDQIHYDPDCQLIVESGRLFDHSDSLLCEMAAHRCHWNISALYEAGMVDQIVIGYALNDEGCWFQHTWGLMEEALVETSVVTHTNAVLYFGIIVENPIQFVRWCEMNKPGSGRVRRRYE